MHIYFHINVFVFFGKIPRSGVSGLYGSPVFIFLRRLFISGCTNLHSHRRCTGVPLSPHPRQRSLSAASRSDRCETVPRAALIYISLRISDVDHSFMFFFFLHTQVFLERLSTHILCPRWGCAVCPFDVEFVSSLYVLPTNPLSDRLFSHAVGWVFILCKIFLVWLGSIP